MPVIAKSDIFILLVSASLLAVGIYRWQDNLAVISANAQKAQVQNPTPNSNTPVISAISPSSVAVATSMPSVQTSSAVVVSNQQTISSVAISSVDDTTTAIPDNTEIRRPLYGTYIVVSGDSLSKIAQQFGTTVETLQDINTIDGTLIDVGQLIQFPLPAN